MFEIFVATILKKKRHTAQYAGWSTQSENNTSATA
jgi:hypothetical protein